MHPLTALCFLLCIGVTIQSAVDLKKDSNGENFDLIKLNENFPDIVSIHIVSRLIRWKKEKFNKTLPFYATEENLKHLTLSNIPLCIQTINQFGAEYVTFIFDSYKKEISSPLLIYSLDRNGKFNKKEFDGKIETALTFLINFFSSEKFYEYINNITGKAVFFRKDKEIITDFFKGLCNLKSEDEINTLTTQFFKELEEKFVLYNHEPTANELLFLIKNAKILPTANQKLTSKQLNKYTSTFFQNFFKKITEDLSIRYDATTQTFIKITDTSTGDLIDPSLDRKPEATHLSNQVTLLDFFKASGIVKDKIEKNYFLE